MAEELEDERDVELSSITAIFPELIIDPQDSHTATLELDVAPSTPLIITFKAQPTSPLAAVTPCIIPPSINGENRTAGPIASALHFLTYMPSLNLKVHLPDGYPEECPPLFTLHSSWLPEADLQRLDEEGRKLWEEYGRSQVVFAYIDFLQQEVEKGFGLGQHISKPLLLPVDVKDAIMAHDRKATRQNFEKVTFDCGVCLEPKKGSACYKLSRCGHVFCVGCLQDYYNNAITEGDVSSVKCLNPECGLANLNAAERRAKKRPTLHPTELLKIPIETDQVQRYVDLKQKKKLESDKSTIYCPRTWCQGPARSKKYKKFNVRDGNLADFPQSDSEDSDTEDNIHKGGGASKSPAQSSYEDRLKICSHCAYAFCGRCLKSWHGELNFCLPPTSDNTLTAEEQASYDYIRLNTSPCPTCGSPCQKTHGCNHMRCYTCNSHFCYLCSAWLQPQDPYKHFNREGSECFQRLWELEEGDEGADVPGQRRNGVFAGPRAAELANAVLNGRANAAGVIADAMPAAPVVPELTEEQRNERAARALQRFLQLAANDEEDGWDSDELEELFN